MDVEAHDVGFRLFDELCPTLQIGISLDGDAQGNAWRVGYDGNPVYPRVAQALNLLAAEPDSRAAQAAPTPAQPREDAREANQTSEKSDKSVPQGHYGLGLME